MEIHYKPNYLLTFSNVINLMKYAGWGYDDKIVIYYTPFLAIQATTVLGKLLKFVSMGRIEPLVKDHAEFILNATYWHMNGSWVIFNESKNEMFICDNYFQEQP